MVIAGAMMAYNAARFGNPLEFGHNYLPEFTESQYGQFHYSYILPNFLQLFRLPTIDGSLSFHFPLFNGFLFFLVNPVFLVYGIHLFRERKLSQIREVLCFSLLPLVLVLLSLCAHKTMGGWQFGARYTVDMLPAALLGICLLSKRSPRHWERFLWAVGIMINVFGMVFMFVQENL